MNQGKSLRRDACVFRVLGESLQMLYGVGRKCGEILNSCLHDESSPFPCGFPGPLCEKRPCHKGLVLFVNTMTEQVERM
jgi:hypothetical protein